jgi:hypothetical protein
MKKLTNAAQAAKIIRDVMKHHGVKGRVTSKTYSGGSSVDVTLDECLPATREQVELFASRFQYGEFDGMTDSYNYTNRDDSIPQVRFVFVRVDWTQETIDAAKQCARDMGYDEIGADRMAWDLLSGRFGNFWRDRKPRVRSLPKALRAVA